MADDDQLSREAKAFGVETSYYDALGTRRGPGEPALRAIVTALADSAKAAGAVGLPTTQIIRKGRGDRLASVGAEGTGWRLVSERRAVATGARHENAVTLPAKLRVGSYRLEFDPPEAQSAPAPVIVAPAQSYQPAAFDEGARVWALAAQLYSLRSRRNWGIGDFTDLKELVRIAGHLGAAGVGLNPLHAISLDNPSMISPYSPTSRLFLNALYIDVDRAPGFPGLAAAGLADEVARLRESEFVDYAGVIPAKLKGLRLAYESFEAGKSAERREDFEAFKAERGALIDAYAAFETLHARFGPPWWEWPAEWRTPSAEQIAGLWRSAPQEMGFHAYVQWVADRQLRSCANVAKRHRMPIGLYLDVAVGVVSHGSDVWSNQTAYVRQLSSGAPPDMLNTEGQDWGLASFHPVVLAGADFQPLRETLRAVMRHAGAIRLDHVLGLNRLFMIPHGFKAIEGAYVHFPLDAMLAVVAQESHAEHCVVIGEDLGTVPDGFRETLADWNVWSYRVMMFERGHYGEFLPPGNYPAQALVSFGTHDLPTFPGWLAGRDLAVKLGIGLNPGETEGDRAAGHRAMAEALARECGAEKASTVEMVRFLARTPSRLLVVAAEDAFDVPDQINIPGTILEHPNWRRRLPVLIEDFEKDPRVSAVAEALRREGRAFPSQRE